MFSPIRKIPIGPLDLREGLKNEKIAFCSVMESLSHQPCKWQLEF